MVFGVFTMDKEQYGAMERKEKRIKRQIKIERFVEALLTTHLPQISHEICILEEEYSSKIAVILNSLHQKYTRLADKEIARNTLSRTIQKHNQQCNQLLPIPSPLIRHVAENSFKNARWFQRSRIAHQWYNDWFDSINNRPTGTTFTQEELLANILFCSMVCGGLLIEEALENFKGQLAENNLKIYSNTQHIWVDLEFKSSQLSHNYEKSGKTLTLRRWFIDTLTLGWINQYKQLNTPFECHKKVWTLLQEYIAVDTDYVKSKHRGLKTLKNFCYSCISVLENRKFIILNQAHINYLLGRIDASSLDPASYALLWSSSSLKPIESNTSIHLFSNSSPINPSKKSASSTPTNYANVIEEVNLAFKSLEYQHKPSLKACLESLLSIHNKTNLFPLNLLLQWLVSLAKDNKKVSTLRRYWASIGKGWLIESRNIDLYSLDESDWEELYSSIVAMEGSDKAKHYTSERLSQFHRYLVRQHDMPILSSIFTNNDIESSIPFVRAVYIPEMAFRQLLEGLQKIDLPLLEVEKLSLIFIIAYRTGLRRGEIIKLRLNDVENSEERWLFIRNNKFGDNKTSSALRKIPLSCLLTDKERKYFENYLVKRKNLNKGKNTLLFSQEDGFDKPYSGYLLSETARQLLSHIMGQKIIFHHFRHTALSRIQVILEGGLNVQDITPYNDEQVERIQIMLGQFTFKNSKRDIYWAMAAFAGHISPQTTFHSYLHFNDLLVGDILNVQDHNFTTNGIFTITGFSNHLITRRITHGFMEREVPYVLYAKDIYQTLKPHLTLIELSEHDVQKPVKRINSEPLAFQRQTPSVWECYEALKMLEDGAIIEEVELRFNLEQRIIRRWRENGTKLTAKTTRRNVSRVVSKRRNVKKLGTLFTPAIPVSKIENEEVTVLIDKAREIFKQSPDDLKWCLDYFFENSNTSKQGVTFLEISKFQKFYKICTQLYPASRLRLELRIPKDKSALIDSWQHSTKRAVNSLSFIKGDKNTQSGKMTLSVRHPKEDEMAKKIASKKYSTNALGFTLHMLYVMIN